MGENVSCSVMLQSEPVLERLSNHFVVSEYFMANTPRKSIIYSTGFSGRTIVHFITGCGPIVSDTPDVKKRICNTEDPAGPKATISGNVSQKHDTQG